jgi:hypothetical protein
MTPAGKPRAIHVPLPSNAQRYRDLETSGAILCAIEAITGHSLLDEPTAENIAYQLFEAMDDDTGAIGRYLKEHYSAEEGDVLSWDAGSLCYFQDHWW